MHSHRQLSQSFSAALMAGEKTKWHLQTPSWRERVLKGTADEATHAVATVCDAGGLSLFRFLERSSVRGETPHTKKSIRYENLIS